VPGHNEGEDIGEARRHWFPAHHKRRCPTQRNVKAKLKCPVPSTAQLPPERLDGSRGFAMASSGRLGTNFMNGSPRVSPARSAIRDTSVLVVARLWGSCVGIVPEVALKHGSLDWREACIARSTGRGQQEVT